MNTTVARTCSRCKRMHPPHRFARWRKGGESRRNVCQDCTNVERKRWLARMSAEELAEYNARQEAHDRANQERLKLERARIQRERLENTRAIVSTLRARGLTCREIARRSGLHRDTVNLIANGTELKYQTAKVEERLAALLIDSNKETSRER